MKLNFPHARYINRVLCERRCAAAIGGFSPAFWHCDDIGDSDIRPKMAGLIAEFGHEALEDSLRQGPNSAMFSLCH